ncbi:hypothetical protein [Vulcanisaeta moutnovskia]|nr:hypothetical protein [Vulcanisaeta moutnovskia]
MAIIGRLLRIIEEREALLNRYSPDELSDIKRTTPPYTYSRHRPKPSST